MEVADQTILQLSYRMSLERADIG